MPSRTIRLLTARLLVGSTFLLLVLPALASKVYQWKDAKGVTHYSDSPPPGNPGAKNRQLSDGPAPPATDAKKPSEAPNCVTARNNLAQLGASLGFWASVAGGAGPSLSWRFFAPGLPGGGESE